MHDGQPVDELPDGTIGFVYRITHPESGRFYIGKKLATKAHTRTVKGKRKRSRVESDWRDYHGSSAELQADVERLGSDSFDREILLFCQSRGQCSYHEARLQFEHRVLERVDSYNSFIGCKIHKKHLKGVDTRPKGC